MQGFKTVHPVCQSTAHVHIFSSYSFGYQCTEAQHGRGHALSITEVPLSIKGVDLGGQILT